MAGDHADLLAPTRTVARARCWLAALVLVWPLATFAGPSPAGQSTPVAAPEFSTRPAPARSSPIALTPSGRLLVVVNPDSGSVSLVETGSRQLVAEVPVGVNPQAVAVEPGGRFAYVTLAGTHELAVVDLTTRQTTTTWPVGIDPFGVVVDSGGRVYVANTSDDTVTVLEPVDPGALWAAAPPARSVALAPGPRGLALSPDGRWLYVTHFRSGRLTRLDVQTLELAGEVDTGPDSNWAQAMAVDAGGELGYMPLTRSHNTGKAIQYDSTVFPTVAVVDLTTPAHLRQRRIALDVADRPVNLPVDAALSPTGKLWIVNAGSNDVSVLDTASGFALAHLQVGDNPRGIALTADGNTAYINNVLSGTVTVIDARRYRVTGTLTVTEIPLPADVLNGKRLFNTSARPAISRSGWMSCSSCHFDGASDGRIWPTADGPRNTPALIGLADTAPYHWSGNFDELQDAEGFIRSAMGGSGLAAGPVRCTPACDQAPPHAGLSADLDDLAAFLRSRQVPPSPYRNADGSASVAAARGERLFTSKETGCAFCHVPPVYTARRKIDVGTANSPQETQGPAIDTPSLRGVWRTAPYLHDGSAPTLLDVLTTANPGDRHGRTSQLSPAELADLVAFLRSL